MLVKGTETGDDGYSRLEAEIRSGITAGVKETFSLNKPREVSKSVPNSLNRQFRQSPAHKP